MLVYKKYKKKSKKPTKKRDLYNTQPSMLEGIMHHKG